ncbi:alpha/beta hydrolase family protein [Zavarzinella formosa]|uniref:alpha/beta hydrolase family protein n=1 Tax=Zavarzinella formosa TaxID=360055 RepID=UPI0002FA5D0B|nr:alpha/beta hydrolase [Zavarzinella formosa]
MPCRRLFLCLLLLAAPGFAEEPKKEAPKKESTNPIIGNWLGTVKFGPIELRLGFRITSDKDGKLTAKMDSFDQGAMNLPVETVTFEKNVLTLKLPPFKIGYTGELQPDNETIKGDFEQGLKIPMELKRVEKMPSLLRPQNPKKPYPYDETEVAFDSKAAGVKLGGTLTTPKGDGPFPAVVMITGSGPQDRDETLMGHKPFLVIADHLTRKGIAVLRFDDRGVGKSTGDHSKATSMDFAEDAAGAVAFLKTRKEIGKIGLMGHSEGGLIAPIVAAKNPEIGFIIMMAGPGLPGDEILIAQSAAILKGAKMEKAGPQTKELQTKMFAMIKKDAEEKEVLAVVDEYVKSLPEKEQKEFKNIGGVARMNQVTTPWFRAFIKYDPRPTLQQVKCPVLAFNGELDIQVIPKENLTEIEKALKAGNNPDVTIKELPKLNHLFQTAKTGMVNEYGQIEETIAPVVLDMVTEWILKRK